MRRADSEIISEGLRAVYPGAAKAGPIFHFVNVTEKRQRGISIGTPTEDVRWDFQGGGVNPATPIGSIRVYPDLAGEF